MLLDIGLVVQLLFDKHMHPGKQQRRIHLKRRKYFFSILLLGLLAIAAGYLLLSAGRLSWGPLLLVGGYCVALPVSIWRLFRTGVGE